MTTAPAASAERSASALALDPVGLAEFAAGYRERRPLVVDREEEGRFDPILARADVARLLGSGGLRAPAFRLVRDGGQLPLAAYTDDVPWSASTFGGLARAEEVLAEIERGATLVLQGLNLHWPPAAAFCRGLEAELGCPAQANAYLTPSSSQGFGLHHDTHDVLVLQVSGHKRWRIHAPVLELPLGRQKWSPDLGDPGPPVLDVTLRAGDTLYLPRGWPHAAVAERVESLHLTIGLHPVTRLEALRAALDECAEDVEFRRGLDADGVLPGDLLGRLAGRLAPDEVARRARRRFVLGRRPLREDLEEQLAALPGLGVDDPLERRRTVIADLEDAGPAGLVLLFEGREVRLPPQAAAAVRWMHAATGTFTSADAPGPLDGPGRLVLVRRLVREGYLRLADPPSA